MSVITVIIIYAIHFAVAYLLIYSSDNGSINTSCNWNEIIFEKETFKLVKPSLLDFRDSQKNSKMLIYDFQNYVDEIINPSYHYFILKKELSSNTPDKNNVLAIGLILQSISLAAIIGYTIRIFPLVDWSDITLNIVVIGMSLLICSIGCFILSKIHSKFFSLEKFDIPLEEYKQHFSHQKKQFAVSDDIAFNNYIIICHYHYLLRIKESVVLRQYIYKFLLAFTTIIYILFIHQTD